jgi:hypothetical protein
MEEDFVAVTFGPRAYAKKWERTAGFVRRRPSDNFESVFQVELDRLGVLFIHLYFEFALLTTSMFQQQPPTASTYLLRSNKQRIEAAF